MMKWMIQPRPEVASLQPYVPGKPMTELARETGIPLEDIVKLASNESPLGPSPLLAQHLFAMAGQFSEQDVAALTRYPDGNGHQLKSALQAHTECDVSQITLGNGSNDVLMLIAQAFLQPGESAWYSEHAFAIYRLAIQQAGGRGLAVPADAFAHDIQAFLSLLQTTAAPKLIFLANPNNPTGTYFSQAELEALLTALPSTTLVVLDEAYCEYVEESDYPKGIALLSQYPNLVVTRTFSKVYGLAALRVGYALSSAEIADFLNRVRQPFNVNTLALAAAELCLQDTAHLQAAVAHNREQMQDFVRHAAQLGLETLPSVANFVTLDLKQPATPIYQALLLKGVIARPLEDYQMPQHLRVSLGLANELEQFWHAFETLL